MELPFFLPYIEVVYIVLGIGLGLTVFTAIGVFFKLWSWHVPRSMIYSFLAIGAILLFISYLVGRYGI